MFFKRDKYYYKPKPYYVRRYNAKSNSFFEVQENSDKLAGKWAAMKYYNNTGLLPPTNFYNSFVRDNKSKQSGYNETAEYITNRLRAGYPGLSDADTAFLEDLETNNHISGSNIDLYNKAYKRNKPDTKTAPKLTAGFLEDTAAAIAPIGASIFAGRLGALTGNPLLGTVAGIISKPFLDKGLEAHGHKSSTDPNVLDKKVDTATKKIYEKSTLTMDESRKLAETSAMAGLGATLVGNYFRKSLKKNNKKDPANPGAGFNAVPLGANHTAYIPRWGKYNNGFGSINRYRRYKRYRRSRYYRRRYYRRRYYN